MTRAERAYPRFNEDAGPTISGWGEHYNVHHELLPFPHRNRDPISELRDLHRQLKEFPKTKATWTIRDLDTRRHNFQSHTAAGEFTPLGYFLGCYTTEAKSMQRWINPYYVHPHDHTPSRISRNDHYHLCARMGVFSLKDVAQMWNQVKQAVAKWLRSRGERWGELRAQGKLRFARTMETIHNWRGTQFSKLARLFNIPRTTLLNWRQEITKPLPPEPQLND